MKDRFVKSSPHFFRMILNAMLLLTVVLLAAALIVPAPLQQAANPAVTPNPVKSAWFLLWIQEVVSWSRLMIYPVMALAILFLLLPWLPGTGHAHRAEWLPRGQRLISWGTLAVFAAILLLTFVAMVLRGLNWSLMPLS